MTINVYHYKASGDHSLRNMTCLRPGLCYVRRGTKIMHLNESICGFSAHSLIFYAPGEYLHMQHIPDKGSYEAVMITFTTSLLNDFRKRYATLLNDSMKTVTTTSSLSITEDIYEAFRRVTASYDRRESDVVTNHLLEGLLIQLALAGYCLSTSSSVGAYKDYIAAALIKSPSENPTLRHFAVQLNMSESTLTRRLKDEGTRFRLILDNVRLTLAMEYIQTTQMPVGLVAANVGYASSSKFIARFRHRFGITPGELRKSLSGR